MSEPGYDSVKGRLPEYLVAIGGGEAPDALDKLRIRVCYEDLFFIPERQPLGGDRRRNNGHAVGHGFEDLDPRSTAFGKRDHGYVGFTIDRTELLRILNEPHKGQCRKRADVRVRCAPRNRELDRGMGASDVWNDPIGQARRRTNVRRVTKMADKQQIQPASDTVLLSFWVAGKNFQPRYSVGHYIDGPV